MNECGLADIKAVVPHRPPFLLLDNIIDYAPDEFAIASRYIDPADPVFTGHFPDFAVYPGVLMIEIMAQTACFALAIAAQEDAGKELYVLARVNQCTFKRMVRPNETLTIESRLTRDFGRLAMFKCVVHVGDELAAEAELLVGRNEQP